MPIPSDIQEMLLWMPKGDQGNDNLPTLQEYTDIAIRQDGALNGALADCKTYNKVLYQLTRMMVGLSLYMNSQGFPVRDDYTPEVIRDILIEALKTNIKVIIDPPEDSPEEGIKRDITYEQLVLTMDKEAPIGAALKVLPYDVGRSSTIIFFDGVILQKGLPTDQSGYPSWYEVGDEKTTSDIIKCNCIIPKGSQLVVVRFGDLRYLI